MGRHADWCDEKNSSGPCDCGHWDYSGDSPEYVSGDTSRGDNGENEGVNFKEIQPC